MSIIYNALQKIQRSSRDLGTFQKPTPPRTKWIDSALLVIIVVLFLLVIFAYYPKIKMKWAKPAATPQSSSLKPAVPPSNALVKTKMLKPLQIPYQGNLVLNGVFLSDDEKIALINSQPHHIGDLVEGKKIISIQMDKILLQQGTHTFVLRATS